MRVNRNCDHCGKIYITDTSWISRGHTLCCSVQCSKELRAKNLLIELKSKFSQSLYFGNIQLKTITEKFKVRCIQHGDFETCIKSLRENKFGCKSCGAKRNSSPNKGTGFAKIVDNTKQCSKCNNWLNLDNYKINKGRYNSQCKDCEKERQRLRAAKPERRAKINIYKQQKISAKRIESGVFPGSIDIKYCNCLYCNKTMTLKKSSSKKTCSNYCTAMFTGSLNKGKKIERAKKEYKCRSCKMPFISNSPGRCNKCKKDREKVFRKIHKAKRRASLKNVVAELVNPFKVFQRDKWRCRLCDCRVQKVDIMRDNAAELDHIVQLSLGGPHTYSNVQTLCRKCNQAKSNNFEGQLVLSI